MQQIIYSIMLTCSKKVHIIDIMLTSKKIEKD